MNKKELAYLAGFFDGEGSVIIDKNHGMACVVASTTKWILELLRFNFGGSINTDKKIRYEHGHICYHWKINSTNAESFLQAILPYLKLKRPEAEVAIKFQVRKDKTHFVSSYRKVPKSERVLREADRILLQKMKEQVKGGNSTVEIEQQEEKANEQLPLL